MEIKEIEWGGYRIGIPIPFPMKYVYCYLFPQDDYYIMIDTGFNYEAGREAWKEVFALLQIEPTDVKKIYLTHFHPDHAGLAGWMQQYTGAELLMHEVDKAMMHHVWGDEYGQAKRIKEMMVAHGAPLELSEEIERQMKKMIDSVQPLPTIQVIPGEVALGNVKWEVLHTPGHSSGHICFYQPEEQVLLAGDHILDKITPNISVWPRASQRPLHDYIQSLQEMKQLPIQKAYPAHGKIIHDVMATIDFIISHHEQRLAEMEEMSQMKTAYQVAKAFFGNRELTAHQWRFAIAETIAHLEYLAEENRVEKVLATPVQYNKKSVVTIDHNV